MDADATTSLRRERRRVDRTVGLVLLGLLLSVLSWLMPLNIVSFLLMIGAVSFELTAVIYELVLWSRIKREALVLLLARSPEELRPR